MTREEAIEMLIKDKEQRGECFISDALDIAIKALEQELNEVCDWFKQYIDIPSNTVLIEFSDGTSKRVKRGGYLANVENNLRRMMQVQIERESYEDAIRPKGHWIYDKSFANWKCSKCGETPKTMGYVGTGTFMAEHFKYCNHCGAEMEGSEEV